MSVDPSKTESAPAPTPLFSPRKQKLWDALTNILPTRFPEVAMKLVPLTGGVKEINLELPPESAGHYQALVQFLRDEPTLSFKTLIDVCGIDYAAYGEPMVRQEQIARGEGIKVADQPCGQSGAPRRFAVVVHLLSLENNVRLRVKMFVPDNDFPVVDSLTTLHPSADWFEREAFDLFGIAFEGHEDLRRLLTDYGFIGHPFRKDFPVTGYVEMRFDAEQHRVIYEPVSIERRDIKPREIRPDGFAVGRP